MRALLAAIILLVAGRAHADPPALQQLYDQFYAGQQQLNNQALDRLFNQSYPLGSPWLDQYMAAQERQFERFQDRMYMGQVLDELEEANRENRRRW